MNKIYEELSAEVKASAMYKEAYKCLCINLAILQIKNTPRVENIIDIATPDINYLLKCANLFILSSNATLHEHALRIAQYTIEVGSTPEKDVAYIILDSLLNKPSIILAKRLKYIDNNIDYKLPLNLTLNKLQRENEYSFNSNSETVLCNSFQKKFLEKTTGPDNLISITAPTSAGKSFIVKKWLINELKLENNKKINLAIIVPTRALINQYERDLKSELKNKLNLVHIETMPFRNGNLFKKKKVIYIFTQERMSAFLAKNASRTKFNILFVDEAQKIGDSQRGVLLETVISQIQNSKTKIVFASPFVENPEDIFIDSTILKSELMPINQNFFKITQEPGKPLIWNIYLIYDNNLIKIADILLENKIRSKAISKRLATFASLITKENKNNNLIFANNGKDAEEIAKELAAVSDYNIENNEDIQNLINLCKETVHKNFSLITYLKRGIAFHYGSMPQLIRIKIEELYNKQIIKTLICTSTLLEGVNLSCKNIFVKDPKKGQSKKMSVPDIFNLVGRAGRLGKEFYGNIFYIDWSDCPLKNEKLQISRTIQKTLKNHYDIILSSFKEDFNTITISDNEIKNSIEGTLGYLCTRYLKTGDISKDKEVLDTYNNLQIIELNKALETYVSKIELPQSILNKHPTTYHYSMQKLLNYFKKRHPKEPEKYLIDLKHDEKIIESLIPFLNRMNNYFNIGNFNKKFLNYIAYLVKNWIKFQNIETLISVHCKRLNIKEEHFNTAVRQVFKNIDEYARYLVPKLLRCYLDVLNFYLSKVNREDLIYTEDEMEMIMEYGIETKTQMSMITLGLSRATILKLCNISNHSNQHLLEDMGMDELKSLNWLINNIEYIESNKKLNKLLIEEIYDVINSYKKVA